MLLLRQLLSPLLLLSTLTAAPVPEGFVKAKNAVPGVVLELRYAGEENFVGSRIDGYEKPVCYLSAEAAEALAAVQAELETFGLGVKIFDAYRPQRAVDHFVRWAEDLNDTGRKAAYYPDVDKTDLFKKGYIAARSGHSRGSTVDLTLIDCLTGEALDMGTGFDLFGPASWPTSSAVTVQQRANRLLLRSVMLRHGFRPLREEWWHFTLQHEPYPDRYFNFPVR